MHNICHEEPKVGGQYEDEAYAEIGGESSTTESLVVEGKELQFGDGNCREIKGLTDVEELGERLVGRIGTGIVVRQIP